MKKRILSYRQKVDALLAHPDTISPDRWSDILQEHLIQIGFFQHERLVHLILTLISIVAALMICNPALYVLTLLLVVLLIPYIMHYYTLENEVQKMYGQYDRILEHMREENQGLR